jgi:hypothetical protein
MHTRSIWRQFRCWDGTGWVTLEGSLSFACSKRANVHSNGKCMSDGADRMA